MYTVVFILGSVAGAAALSWTVPVGELVEILVPYLAGALAYAYCARFFE